MTYPIIFDSTNVQLINQQYEEIFTRYRFNVLHTKEAVIVRYISSIDDAMSLSLNVAASIICIDMIMMVAASQLPQNKTYDPTIKLKHDSQPSLEPIYILFQIVIKVLKE
jgi:hypothetical protein